MCSPNDPTIDNTPKTVITGQACPCCAVSAGSVLDYMVFLDPHGTERVDREVIQCSTEAHVFRWKGGELRLVAENGRRIHPARTVGLPSAV